MKKIQSDMFWLLASILFLVISSWYHNVWSVACILLFITLGFLSIGERVRNLCA